MTTPSRSAIRTSLRKIERREWLLWASAVLVTLLLTLGIASFIFPLLTQSRGDFESLHLSLAVRGLVALVLLFDIYTIYQQLQIQRTRRELAQREELFWLISENAADMIAVVDADGHRLYNSPAYERILGYSPEELKSTSSFAQIHPDDLPRVQEAASAAQIGGSPRSIEYRMRHKNGTWRVLESTASTVRNDNGEIDKLVIVNRDVSERKLAETALCEKQEQLRLLQDIATNANQAKTIAEAMHFAVGRVCEFTGWGLGHVCLASSDHKHLLSSHMWSSSPENRFHTFLEAFEKTPATGTDLPSRVLATSRPAWIRDVGNDPNFSLQTVAEQAGIKSAFAFPVLSGSGVVAVLEFFGHTCSDPAEEVVGLMGHVGTQLGQVVERVRAQEKLLHDAFHDPLTSLPNRALFLDRLGRAVARAKRHKDYKFAVLFIDIDRFKIVNDSLGHPAGDDLIIQVSRRIFHSLRLEDVVSRPSPMPGSEWRTKDDTLARLGGDEFTVLLDDIRDPSDGIRVAERIQNSLAEPFVICGQDIFTTASIGITVNSAHATAADVLRDADTAMYRAKLHGKARCEVFDQAMHEQSVNRLTLETDLRRALEREEFRVHYQPIIALRTGNISGFEALLRWHRPEKGLVLPTEFIGVAEEMGLIVLIGMWVLRTACEQVHQWQLESPQELPLTMSVNISARQFMQDDLVTQIAKVLRETGVQPSSIKLEITESVTMGDAERTIKVVNELKKLGVRLSIDDFGTGYSSLSYLRRFPMDTLKIDRSFVSNLEDNSENREIIRTIVALARNLGMDVVAEGTETLDEINYLKTLDCEYAQGFFYSKAMDSATARALLRENREFGHRSSIMMS